MYNFFVLALFSIPLILLPVSFVKGDIYAITTTIEGISLHNSTELFLPVADVSINITKGENITVDFYSSFVIESNITQTVTLAFVYPQTWEMYPWEIARMENFTILVNQLQIDYTLLEWDDLGFADQEEAVTMTGTWVLDAFFAKFEVDISNSTPTNIEVTHKEIHMFLGHEFEFGYIFGSARSFSGSTHQTIIMRVTEDVPFLDLTFEPNWQLTTWVEETTTYALWDFIAQDTDYDLIQMNGVVSEYFASPPIIDHGLIYFPIWFPLSCALLMGVIVYCAVREYRELH